MANQTITPRSTQGVEPVPAPAVPVADWRKLDFAADCLCVRSDAATAPKAG